MSSERRDFLVPVLLALSGVTGLIDAVSYLALGRVFTANMTGNVIFLGFAAAGAPGLSVARSAAALLAFAIGAAAGGRMALRLGSGPRHRWTGAAFAAESTLLFLASATALGAAHGQEVGAARSYALIVLTALAMGVRNGTVRKLGIPDLTTTVLTLTIAGLAADSSLGGGTNAGWGRRVGAIAAMLVGAGLGAALLGISLALTLAVAASVSFVCAGLAYRSRA